MNEIILLNKNRSKKSVNDNNSLAIRPMGSKKLLPIDPINTTISEIVEYNNERENCSNIRLTVQINPICSNVLFNNITEIVKNEGTKDVKCLNYSIDNSELGNVMFKNTNFFINDDRVTNAIRDTQLTNEKNGFKYHCGIDIFNNHYLRSKTFKTICPTNGSQSDSFNTISDFMRTYEGKQIKGYSDNETCKINGQPDLNMHIYLNEEILSYKEAVSNKLIEENGWFGFTNVGKIKVYGKDDEYDWFKCINNRKPCDFIDLYPERDLFYFEPKYNSHKRRIEKNWNYCITYPSSSTTKGIPFIKELSNGTTGLKLMYFDDTIKGMNGTDEIKMFSISKHGLNKGNLVNIYSSVNDTDTLIYKNAKVTKIEDDYTFYIYSDGFTFSKKWINIDDLEGKDTIDGKNFEVSKDKKIFKLGNTNYYIIDGKKVNIDDNFQNISFGRVVNNEQLKYYVRIFSKLPNWKFSQKKPTISLLESNKEYMKEYQDVNHEFDSHIGKLAFSKNIYNDNIAEIVFTDDINIDNLVDNLGRPLSDIYLTILKNNEGYREWYGKNKNINITSDNIEYSHCFGKLSCAFKLSKYSLPSDNYNNLLIINNSINTRKYQGLNISSINDRGSFNQLDSDEIQYNKFTQGVETYNGDINFYGDLCCYSQSMCDEFIIQDIGYRFNTAQRELTNRFKAKDFFNTLTYDEIDSDDYDEGNKFSVGINKINDAAHRKEGYYYKPHNRIRINTFSKDITTLYPNFISVKNIINFDKGLYVITTLSKNSFGDGDYVYLYDKTKRESHKFKTVNNESTNGIINTRTFVLNVGNFTLDVNNKDNYTFYTVPSNMPKYASFYNDGSCRYVWRNIIKNGFEPNSEVEEYPFTNNSFYVNKNFNLYLRRQDPTCTGELRSVNYPYGIVSSNALYEKENKYYNENEIEC